MDKQDLLRKFIDENGITIYDVLNVAEWKQKAFLENCLSFCSGSNRELLEIRDYFIKNSWKFRQLEEDVSEFKYCIVSENISSSVKDYFSSGFKSIMYMKTWLEDLRSSKPIYLIINGRLSKTAFTSIVKYNFEISEIENGNQTE